MYKNNIYIPDGYINAADHTYPGGSQVNSQLYGGMVGQIVGLSSKQAAQLSKTSIGTLRGGLYQYVKTKASPTTAVARGLVLVWSDRSIFEVSVDVGADIANSLVAGVGLNTVTQAKYCWIQIDGEAAIRFKSSGSPEALNTTKTTPVVGDSVISPLDADNGRADVLADATAVVFGTAAAKLGRQMGRLNTAIGADFFGWTNLMIGDRNYGG